MRPHPRDMDMTVDCRLHQAAVFAMPDSHSMAAVCLAATSSGAFTQFETHELIEAGDLTAIAERAKGITYQPPGAYPTGGVTAHVEGHFPPTG